MDLIRAQYMEINLVAITILATMLFYALRMRPDRESVDQLLFVKMLICNMIVLASDAAVFLFRGFSSGLIPEMTHLACCLYFAMHARFGNLWLQYCIGKLFPETRLSKRQRLLFALPEILCAVMTFLSPWTGWIYRIIEGNRYERGPFLPGLIVLSYLYWVISAALILREWSGNYRPRETSLYGTLLLFPLPCVVGVLVQLKFYGLSVVWICCALSLLILFINLQNDQLSRDILTGLFNRRQTNRQLAWEIGHLHDPEEGLFAIMADVDRFKEINDRFGHVVGDQALISVARVLKKSCKSKAFIGRFGGDEFLIIGRVRAEAEIRRLLEEIERNLALFQRENQPPYELSLSMGYSLHQENESLSVDRVISEADREMYRRKVARQAAKKP